MPKKPYEYHCHECQATILGRKALTIHSRGHGLIISKGDESAQKNTRHKRKGYRDGMKGDENILYNIDNPRELKVLGARRGLTLSQVYVNKLIQDATENALRCSGPTALDRNTSFRVQA